VEYCLTSAGEQWHPADHSLSTISGSGARWHNAHLTQDASRQQGSIGPSRHKRTFHTT